MGPWYASSWCRVFDYMHLFLAGKNKLFPWCGLRAKFEEVASSLIRAPKCGTPKPCPHKNTPHLTTPTLGRVTVWLLQTGSCRPKVLGLRSCCGPPCDRNLRACVPTLPRSPGISCNIYCVPLVRSPFQMGPAGGCFFF